MKTLTYNIEQLDVLDEFNQNLKQLQEETLGKCQQEKDYFAVERGILLLSSHGERVNEQEQYCSAPHCPHANIQSNSLKQNRELV